MVALVIEGFDHESSVTDLQAGILAVGSGSANPSLTASGTRWGAGKCLVVTANIVANQYDALFSFTSAASTIYFGVAVKLGSDLVIVVYDVAAGNSQITFTIDSGGDITIARGGTTLGTASAALAGGGWSYLECGVTISATVGVVTLRVNGVQVYTLTGQNTKNTANLTAGQLWFGVNGSASSYIDDLYICDNTGSQNNTFLGDVRVQTLFPTSNAAVAFTPLTGANWSEVNEAAMDSDTSYNYSASAAQDTFNHGALSGTPAQIFAVQVTSAWRKDDASSPTVRNAIVSGGATAYGSTVGVGSTYVYQKDIFAQDPNTSAAWTMAGVNASQHGYDRVT